MIVFIYPIEDCGVGACKQFYAQIAHDAKTAINLML